MSSDRTEKPSAKRLREAREKGQLPRSRDLGQAGALLACVLTLAWMGDRMLGILTTAIQSSLVRMGDTPLASLGAREVTSLALSNAMALAAVVGPVAAASVLAVLALQTAQGGFVFASEALTFDLTRLSPAQGFKRLGFSQNGVELIKAMVAATVLSVLGWQAVRAMLEQSLGLSRADAGYAAAVGWDSLLSLLRKSAIAMVVLAAADYGVQRWRFMKSQRMTKQEVRDEFRLQEGNPEVKGRVRRIQRELVRKRMLAAVPKATVVITNPTHFAVALEYHRAALPAPRVVAKGQSFMALRIREIARQHGVPIVENPPLARALYKGAEVGDVIPGALFEAVAEVLAYLIRLRQLVL
jgi:flagellar biosynthetic protein FlhB